ncbi:hypothetical protein Tco_1113616 [Tanacetum coccineum]|uniref:Uncharacterized protein n=1 Tax=Tanacetum coccineum TaxID=301880 RepID=A0ABQ5ISP2_9ASTR
MSAKDSITTQTCEYHVILPKSNQTIFDAPPGYIGLYTHSFSLENLRLPLTEFFCELMVVSPLSTSSEGSIICVELEHGQQRPAIMAGGKEMDFKNFIYTEDDEDLTFLPKEPSLGFSTGSPFVSVNTKPLKANEEPDIQPVEVTADSGGSLKPELPPVKRKLASGSSTSRATRAKTSSLKDDAPFLTVLDDDEGLFDVLVLKDANACHLKISAITPLAWKNHLDNHIDLELLDLHDHCYARQVVVDNTVNRRSRKLLQVIKKLRGECDVMRSRERARDEECEGLRVKCEAAMTDFEKNPAVVAL